MNRDPGCNSSSCPAVAPRPRRSPGSSDYSATMDPELFDFCSLNSRCREDGASLDTTRSSQRLQRLPVPRRSYSDDMLQPHAQPPPRISQARGGPKKSRRFIPPFKRIGGRGGSIRGEAIGISDHAIASVSSHSRTTLSSKSRQSQALYGGDGEASDGPREAHADSSLPFDSFAMALSGGESDCISEVSVDNHDDADADADQAQALHHNSNHRPLCSATVASPNSLSAGPPSHRARAAASSQVAFAEDASPPNRVRRVSTDGGGTRAAPAIISTDGLRPEPAMMVEVVSGSFVPLIGTRETLDAYRTGSVVDQACFGCNEFLLCCERATLVICPVCRSVSPVIAVTGRAAEDQTESSLGGRGGLLGLGLTVHLIETEFLGLP